MIKGCYLHQVQYYETDAMQIVHHSNYLRWFEEARLQGIAEVGLPYRELEDRGIMIPVLSASCEYKQAVRYGQTVKICYEVESFRGLRFTFSYRVYSEDDSVLHAVGSTTHCFLNREMKPMNIKRFAPDIYAILIGDADVAKS